MGIFVLLVFSHRLKPNLHLPNETLSVLAGVLGSLKKEFTNPGPVTEHNSSECINEVGPVLLAQATGDPTVEHCQLTRGGDQQVSRMQVPMPKVVMENLQVQSRHEQNWRIPSAKACQHPCWPIVSAAPDQFQAPGRLQWTPHLPMTLSRPAWLGVT